MLRRIIGAVIFAIIAYFVCILAGELLSSLNVSIAVIIGNFLSRAATLISILVFLYYAFVGELRW